MTTTRLTETKLGGEKNQNMALQQNNNSSKKTYLTKKSVITHKLSAFPNNNTKHIPIDYYLI